jgi:hypothetical protein
VALGLGGRARSDHGRFVTRHAAAARVDEVSTPEHEKANHESVDQGSHIGALLCLKHKTIRNLTDVKS